MKVFIAGGNGFLGSKVVSELKKKKIDVVLAPDLDINDLKSNHLAGANVVVNLVGIIAENKKRTFQHTVIDGTKHMLSLAGRRGFVYVSAIGASPNGTPYQKSKWAAEQLIMRTSKKWAIVRPSVIVGQGNHLESTFAPFLKMHFMPVFGHGKIQPVDADLIAKQISDACIGKWKGVRELGGPEIMTWKEFTRNMAKSLDTWALTPLVPKMLGRIIAILPGTPFTLDQWRMMQEDNIARIS